MRILILSHYFPPEVNAPASRVFEHAEAWVKAGHQVTVLTNVPNHPHGTVYAPYQNRMRQYEVIEGIEVIRLWTYLTPNKGFVRRIINHLTYAAAATAYAPFLKQHYDITLSTSPQFFCGLAGYIISRLKQTPWVLEIRDLWPESILAVGAMKNRRLIRLLESLERFAYSKAERVVSVTDSFVPHIVAKGASAKNVRVIKNGVDLERFCKPAKNEALKESLGLKDKFVAAYVGTHGMAHKLEQVLDVAEQLSRNPHIAILLVGDGAERQRLKRMRDERKLTNVVMLEQQPKEKMPEIWALSDAALVVLSKADTFTKVIPSKLFEAMAMNCPLVLAVSGEAAGLVSQAEAGIVLKPEDSTGLANAITRLFADSALCARLGLNGRRYVEQHFSRRKLASDYTDLFSEVISENRLVASALRPAKS